MGVNRGDRKRSPKDTKLKRGLFLELGDNSGPRFVIRRPGQPQVLTDKEIKEHKKEQIRKYLINRKAKQHNTPMSSTIGRPRIYTEEEARQCKRERNQRHYRENKEACLERSRRWYLRRQVKILKERIGAC